MLCGLSIAETVVYPPEGWEPEVNPLASDWAEPGGRFRKFASQYPNSFNYYLDMNVFSGQLFGQLFEPLISRHPLTLEPEPLVARKVEMTTTEDSQTFVFHIDPNARWSDGKPITADDVIWTFNAIMDPAHLTAGWKVGLSKIEAPEKIDDLTVRFEAKEIHWRNLWSLGGFSILPKHWWETQEEFNRVNFEFPVVSGPYKITRLDEGRSVILGRREDYWGKDDPRKEHLGNFDEIEYRFYGERELALDNFLRGDFDVHAIYTARFWVERTEGARFDNNWIIKQQVFNRIPQGFQGFAMNLRRPQFQDVRVRRALAHLLDRERMNATLMYNQYALHRSYFEDLYSDGNPNPLIEFDVAEARRLLREAGWEVNAQGQLVKDGQRFVIHFLARDATAERFLFIYREALQQVGIQLNINRKDWSAWSDDMKNLNFDMTWAAYSGALFKDPESMWHSRHADVRSTANITGFQHEEVDRLIDSITTELDVEKRHEVVRQIDAILAREVPFILLWNSDHTRLLYWNKFGMPDHVLGKYGSDQLAVSYWWLDPDLDAELRDAREQGLKLPPRPYRVDFDEVFTPAPVATEPLN